MIINMLLSFVVGVCWGVAGMGLYTLVSMLRGIGDRA